MVWAARRLQTRTPAIDLQLSRVVIQDAMDELPHKNVIVTTPTGDKHEGLVPARPVCTVSILRSGEAMEGPSRALMRGISMGKILVQRNEETGVPPTDKCETSQTFALP